MENIDNTLLYSLLITLSSIPQKLDIDKTLKGHLLLLKQPRQMGESHFCGTSSSFLNNFHCQQVIPSIDLSDLYPF